MTTGKSKATDGGLEDAIRSIVEEAMDSAIPEPWEVSARAAQRILALYAAPPQVEPDHAMLARARDWMADNIREADIEGVTVLGYLALYLQGLAPQVEPAEGEIAELVERLKDHYRTDIGMASETGDDIAQAVGALTSQSAELLSLRRKVEETEAERDAAEQKAERQWEGWVKEEVARKAAERKVEEQRSALEHVRAIISEGAMVGFNPLDGSWAERLYASQALTHRALAGDRP